MALLGQVAAVVDRRLSPAKYAAHTHARPVGVSLEIMQLAASGVWWRGAPAFAAACAGTSRWLDRSVCAGGVWVTALCAAMDEGGGGVAA